MTALAEAFNNGERETLPRTIGGDVMGYYHPRVRPGVRTGGL